MPDDRPAPYTIKKRIEWIDLPEPYAGGAVQAWLNYPSVPGTSSMDVFTRIVLDHNLCDFDGQPYPAGGTPEFGAAIPADLWHIIWGAVMGQVGKLSKANAGR